MPRRKIVNVEKTIDKRVRREFQTMHRKTLERFVHALAAQDGDRLKILAVSLAPTRELAEEDFTRIMGTVSVDEGVVVKVPFWFASNRLDDVPVIVAGTEGYI